MHKSFLAMLIASCGGRDIPYEGGNEVIVETAECGDDVDTSVGLTITGTITDLDLGELVEQELCLTAIDPTPALTGGKPIVLAAATTCDTGEFILAGIVERPSVGMFLVVEDCEGQDNLFMQTATGVSKDDYLDLPEDGATLADVNAKAISTELMNQMDTDLNAAGYDGTASMDGFLGGFIFDTDGATVDGASISCSSCAPDYYLDDDASDGLFSTNGESNESSVAAAGAMFVIPGAPVFNYVCSDGGNHSWETALYGSLPEYAVLINFNAN